MKRTMILATAVAALFALSAPGPAQASIANPGLGALTAPLVQDAQFQVYIGPDGRRHHRRYGRHQSRRYRHCWNHRYRVRSHYGWRWRTVRRCGWR